MLLGERTTVIGLLIVFLALFILMVVLKVSKKVFVKPEENKKPADEKLPVVEATSVNEAMEDEDELIAVLTAAVAASLNTSTYNLRIKSYRRVQNNAPVWNKAGLHETINARLN